MTPEQDQYYGRPECSNSDLSLLNKYWQPFQISYDVQQVQNFGTLLDCMITEPFRVDYFNYTCAGQQHTAQEFLQAEAMRRSFFGHQFCKLLVEQSDLQKVTVVQFFVIEWLGFRFTIAVRMKADFNAMRLLGIIADLKSTNETTLAGFMRQIIAFEYHRQAAFYMDLEGCDKFVLIGVSKKAPHHIFMVTITRGDELYKAGKALYQELAFKHFYLFEGLQLVA